MKTLVFLLSFILVGSALAQTPVCTVEGDLKTCRTTTAPGKYLVSGKACDTAGNCSYVAETLMPLCSNIELVQEGSSFVFIWKCQKTFDMEMKVVPAPPGRGR